MLEYIAYGDAYGAGFEFVDNSKHKNDLSGYYSHPLHGIKESYGLPAGSYTDDTQMSIAVSKTLIRFKDLSLITSLDFANDFVSVFRADPRPGYAARFYDFLKTVTDGEDFLERIKPDSERNGAAMRSIPLGLVPSKKYIRELCKKNAWTTHRTETGELSSLAVAMMSHYLNYNIGPSYALTDFLMSEIPEYNWKESYKEPTSINGLKAVHSCLDIYRSNLQSRSMSSLLIDAIARKGDTDTAGAITLGLASIRDFQDDLPKVLKTTIENGPLGINLVNETDINLEKRFF